MLATCYFQLGLNVPALPGWEACRKQIYHPFHPIIMACLVFCVTSLSLYMTHPSAESRKCSIWGRKSKGCHAWGQSPSYPSSVVIILMYQATPKHSTFNHTLRREDQGCEFTPAFHIETWGATTKNLFHQPHTQCTSGGLRAKSFNLKAQKPKTLSDYSGISLGSDTPWHRRAQAVCVCFAWIYTGIHVHTQEAFGTQGSCRLGLCF